MSPLDHLAPLRRDFYARPTIAVARDLLGKLVVRRRADGGGMLVARIVEVEAYLGERDAASHARRGPTPRAAIMFGPPGFLYVYLIYGMHHCMNFVTETDGVAGAVLVRAAEPIAGFDGERQAPADRARQAVRRARHHRRAQGARSHARQRAVRRRRRRAAAAPPDVAAHRRRLRGRVGRPQAALLRRPQPLRLPRPASL